MQDATLRLLLLLCAKINLNWIVFDVEMGFLYGELEEEFFKVPQGYHQWSFEINEDKVLKLLMKIYNLIQAAQQWWKKFMTFLKGSDSKEA